MQPQITSLQRQISQLSQRLHKASALNEQLSVQLKAVQSQLQEQREIGQVERRKAEEAQRGREQLQWQMRRRELDLRRVQEQLKALQSLVSQQSLQERTKLKDQNQRLKAFKPLFDQLQVIWLDKQRFLEQQLNLSQDQALSLQHALLQLTSLHSTSQSAQKSELNREWVERATEQKRSALEQVESLSLKLSRAEARIKQIQQEKASNLLKVCDAKEGPALPVWSVDLCLENSLFRLKDKYSKLHRAHQLIQEQHQRLKRDLKGSKMKGTSLKDRLAESIKRTLAYEQKWHEGKTQKERLSRQVTQLKAMLLSQNEFLQSDKLIKIQLITLLQQFMEKANEQVQIIETPPVDWLFQWPKTMKSMVRFHQTHSSMFQRLINIQQSYKEMQLKATQKNIQASVQWVKALKESKLLEGLQTHSNHGTTFLSQLITTNASLQKDLFGLGRKNAQLQSQNKSLQDFAAELRVSIQSYEKLLQDKNSKNKQLLEVLQRVFRQFQTLKNSFSQSAFEKDRLQSHLHSLQRHVQLLTSTDAAKDASIMWLKQQNKKLSEELNQSRCKIQSLLLQKTQTIQKPIEKAISQDKTLQTSRLNTFIHQQSLEIQRLSNLLRARQNEQPLIHSSQPVLQKQEGLSQLVRVFAQREEQFLKIGKSNSNLFRRIQKIHQLLQLKLKQLEQLKETQQQRRKNSRQQAKKDLQRERQDVRELLDSDRLYKSLSGFLEWARANKKKIEVNES